MTPETRRPESGSARRSTPNSSRQAGGSLRKTLSGLESEMVGGQVLLGCSQRIGSGAAGDPSLGRPKRAKDGRRVAPLVQEPEIAGRRRFSSWIQSRGSGGVETRT
ncbi:hypothetical protein NDU88_007782 [Pleurodeles waltl]|uniref:Uncharacterized protein n=1 Tax=Pleurodeles waltl TaxID=8319 RepID=A0AAV7QN22_PLEWA|nr:hypothetical protein NDU88_007782 [Pleurodeles waltl]